MSTNVRPMRFSVGLFPYDRWGGIGPLGEAARLADDLGFFAIQFPEHIIMPVRPDRPEVSTVWYDNFVLGSHLATLTQRVRLMFHVMVVPYRRPVQTAKLVSTLDQVSGGRLILGVGIGWLRGEFRTLGVSFSQRAAMTDEYIRAMRVLWTEESPSFAGEYSSFANIRFEPKCLQKPHVPIWVGGSGAGPMRRVLEFGDGWAPMVGTLDEQARDIASIKDQLRTSGRDPEVFDFSYSISVGQPDPTQEAARSHVTGGAYTGREAPTSRDEAVETIGRYREAGFNHLSVGFQWETPAELMGKMEDFAAKVMPAFG